MEICFNKDLINKIYLYDPTYYNIFKLKVLPYLQKKGTLNGFVKTQIRQVLIFQDLVE